MMVTYLVRTYPVNGPCIPEVLKSFPLQTWHLAEQQPCAKALALQHVNCDFDLFLE